MRIATPCRQALSDLFGQDKNSSYLVEMLQVHVAHAQVVADLLHIKEKAA